MSQMSISLLRARVLPPCCRHQASCRSGLQHAFRGMHSSCKHCRNDPRSRDTGADASLTRSLSSRALRTRCGLACGWSWVWPVATWLCCWGTWGGLVPWCGLLCDRTRRGAVGPPSGSCHLQRVPMGHMSPGQTPRGAARPEGRGTCCPCALPLCCP